MQRAIAGMRSARQDKEPTRTAVAALLVAAAAARTRGSWRICRPRCRVPRRLRLDAGLLHEAEVADPVDEPELPRTERDAVAVRQTAAHVAPFGQRVSRVSAVAVDVHLEVRNPRVEERREVFIRPDGVDRVPDAPARNERRRGIVRNRDLGAAAERRRAWIDQPDEIRARPDLA